ncbi:hypothetical protein IQ07DRAFT_638566 [Pyrenochaeta sp. DS3sAY3a]|nr:hypothetical protein IQ07DRAFT_638566 [Pyrenochaeta sp. DS3sAY3a]
MIKHLNSHGYQVERLDGPARAQPPQTTGIDSSAIYPAKNPFSSASRKREDRIYALAIYAPTPPHLRNEWSAQTPITHTSDTHLNVAKKYGPGGNSAAQYLTTSRFRVSRFLDFDLLNFGIAAFGLFVTQNRPLMCGGKAILGEEGEEGMRKEEKKRRYVGR